MAQMQHYREAHGVFRSKDAFSEAIGQLPIGWNLQQGADRFAASIQQRSLDFLTFATVSFSPCQCTRVEQFPVRKDGPMLCLTYQKSGRQRMVWNHREEIATPGDIVLWSEDDPMTLDNDIAAKACNLWFPSSFAAQRLGNVDRYVGRKLSKENGLAAILGRHIDALFDGLGQIPRSSSRAILGSSIDLIFACLPQSPPCDAGLSPRTAGMLREARGIIAASKELDDLTPLSVASELRISPRYLQKLFTSAGSTFTGEVAKARLDRARLALRDDRFREISITGIAHWFGFFDCSHFTRCFKRTYGLTPSDYRRSC